MKVFKIRDKETGLFSSGKRDRFVKAGKSWNELHHVKSHLKYQYIEDFKERYHYQNNIPSNWEIIVLSEDGIKVVCNARELFSEENPYKSEQQLNLFVRRIQDVSIKNGIVEFNFYRIYHQNNNFTGYVDFKEVENKIESQLNPKKYLLKGILMEYTLWTSKDTVPIFLGFCNSDGKILIK